MDSLARILESLLKMAFWSKVLESLWENGLLKQGPGKFVGKWPLDQGPGKFVENGLFD